MLSSLVPAHAILVALGRLANRIVVRKPTQATDPDNKEARTPHIITLESQPLWWVLGWIESILLAGALVLGYVVRINYPNIVTNKSKWPVINDYWYLACAAYAVVKVGHWAAIAVLGRWG